MNLGEFVILAHVDTSKNATSGVVEEIDENNNLQSTNGIVKTETSQALDATKTVTTPIETSPTQEPDSPTPEPIAGEHLLQPAGDTRWVWLVGGLLLFAGAAVVSYIFLSRKR